jgi:hypothetical protein
MTTIIIIAYYNILECYFLHVRFDTANLAMEIVQNLFIYTLYVSHIDIIHWKHILYTDL